MRRLAITSDQPFFYLRHSFFLLVSSKIILFPGVRFSLNFIRALEAIILEALR